MLLIVLKLFVSCGGSAATGSAEWLASVRRRGRHAGSSPLFPPGLHTAHSPLQVWHVADTLNCVILVVVYVLRLLVLMLTVREDFTWAPKPRSVLRLLLGGQRRPPDSELARPRAFFTYGKLIKYLQISPQVPPSPPLARCVANPTFPLSLPSNGAWHMHIHIHMPHAYAQATPPSRIPWLDAQNPPCPPLTRFLRRYPSSHAR